jgi:hypothetical protein
MNHRCWNAIDEDFSSVEVAIPQELANLGPFRAEFLKSVPRAK